ncbi:MAG: cell division protein CrgA [Nitriliruptoraceae bacterium]
MPKSKHRRGGRTRPRAHQTHAPDRKPDPSPTWVPRLGAALLVAGVAIILLGYLPGVQSVTSTWIWPGSNWGLLVGFLVLSGGLGVLTRWR